MLAKGHGIDALSFSLHSPAMFCSIWWCSLTFRGHMIGRIGEQAARARGERPIMLSFSQDGSAIGAQAALPNRLEDPAAASGPNPDGSAFPNVTNDLCSGQSICSRATSQHRRT